MTKKEAIIQFNTWVKPKISKKDIPALREAWNNYTDKLCKTGLITQKQYETWDYDPAPKPRKKNVGQKQTV